MFTDDVTWLQIDNLMKAEDEVAQAPKHLVREDADTEGLLTECDVKEEKFQYRFVELASNLRIKIHIPLMHRRETR